MGGGGGGVGEGGNDDIVALALIGRRPPPPPPRNKFGPSTKTWRVRRAGCGLLITKLVWGLVS